MKPAADQAADRAARSHLAGHQMPGRADARGRARCAAAQYLKFHIDYLGLKQEIFDFSYG